MAATGLADLLKAICTPANLRRLVEIVLFFYPKVLLVALGFGPLGPAAGFIAPFAQARLGTPWLFRLGQSIMMGGRAATGYRKAVQVVVLVCAALAEMLTKKKAKRVG